jgi:hypothetical protein
MTGAVELLKSGVGVTVAAPWMWFKVLVWTPWGRADVRIRRNPGRNRRITLTLARHVDRGRWAAIHGSWS